MLGHKSKRKEHIFELVDFDVMTENEEAEWEILTHIEVIFKTS